MLLDAEAAAVEAQAAAAEAEVAAAEADEEAAALAQLEKVYGRGTRVSEHAEEYVWRGRKVLLHFRTDPATAMSMIGFTSLPIDARVRAGQDVMPAAIAP